MPRAFFSLKYEVCGDRWGIRHGQPGSVFSLTLEYVPPKRSGKGFNRKGNSIVGNHIDKKQY